MKFSGYWVCNEAGKVVLQKTVFDETDLDPATNWKQTWQNQDGESRAKGFVDLSAALECAALMLAAAEGRPIDQAELELVSRFSPNWSDDRSEINSLSCLLNS